MHYPFTGLWLGQVPLRRMAAKNSNENFSNLTEMPGRIGKFGENYGIPIAPPPLPSWATHPSAPAPSPAPAPAPAPTHAAAPPAPPPPPPAAPPAPPPPAPPPAPSGGPYGGGGGGASSALAISFPGEPVAAGGPVPVTPLWSAAPYGSAEVVQGLLQVPGNMGPLPVQNAVAVQQILAKYAPGEPIPVSDWFALCNEMNPPK